MAVIRRHCLAGANHSRVGFRFPKKATELALCFLSVDEVSTRLWPNPLASYCSSLSAQPLWSLTLGNQEPKTTPSISCFGPDVLSQQQKSDKCKRGSGSFGLSGRIGKNVLLYYFIGPKPSKKCKNIKKCSMCLIDCEGQQVLNLA